MPELKINGEVRQIEGPKTVGELLAELGLTAGYLAVAVNDAVVPRSMHSSTPLKDGDNIEIINAVGGG